VDELPAEPSASVLAVDVGASKMAAAVIAADGTALALDHTATPADAAAEFLFHRLEQLCRRVLEDARTPAAVRAIGIGCSGPMDVPAGTVSPLNIPAWRDFPLRDRLGRAFTLPCVLDNDAKALALGEHWLGAGRGVDDVVGMVVSSGVGGGIVLGGKLVQGRTGNAGHIGHIIAWPNGPPCGCGAHGCVEAVASGTGLSRRLAGALAEGAKSSLRAEAGAAEIADAARAGDPLAAELMRSAGEAVGRGIASAAALLDVGLFVVGGGIALKAWDLLAPPLQAELERSARLAFTRETRVVQAELGDLGGLLGAAALALNISAS
jgi:glucokinase